MRKIPIECLFVMVALASRVNAEPLPLIRDLPLESVYQAKAKIVVPTQTESTRSELKLPSFPLHRDGVLCLRFEAYLHTPQPAGWNPYLGLVLNSKTVDQYTENGYIRLLKRQNLVETTIGDEPWWGTRDGMAVLHTFFGPGGHVLDERVTNQREEGYWYLLDISDLAHFIRRGADDRIESEQPNTLTFINTFVKGFVPGRKEIPTMVIDHLTIGYLPADVAEKVRRSQMEIPHPISSGPTLAGEGFQLQVAPTGGMQLSVAGDDYFFRSAFSFPAKEKMGFNTLDSEKADGQLTWKPSVQRTKTGDITVTAETPAYGIERTISLDGPRLRMRDTIQNRTGKPIGLVVQNTMALSQVPTADRWRVSGTNRESLLGGAAANPTLFAAQDHSSLGIVAEDNVFRLQLELRRRYNAFDFQTTHFGLDGGKSYTLEWTIYPSTDREYFGFVNRVRRDWGVNYTIEGPFVFDDHIVRDRKVGIYTFGPWLDYHHDGSQTRARYRSIVEPTLKQLKAAEPEAIFMPKLESNLYTMVKTRIAGGEVLPGSDRQSGRYGFTLSLEQSRVLDQGLGPWADSVLRTSDGRIIVDTYYPGYLSNKSELFNLLVYVGDDNYRYEMFIDQIDFVMDELGFNGVYIDQFSQEGAFSRLDRFTFDRWDGHTVDLDATGAIQRTRTDCNLIGAAARGKILKHILDKGGKVVTNGQPTVRETRGLPVFAFQEMDNDRVNPLEYLDGKPPVYYWQARGHLASPIILGLRPVRYAEQGQQRWAEIITKGIITALRNGVLYYYYTSTIPTEGPGAGEYGPLNHMFPFTPEELHEGWLLGRERIITCVSRTFQWPHADEPATFLFDLHGREKPHTFQITRTGNAWQVEVGLSDWNEIAVIEHAR